MLMPLLRKMNFFIIFMLIIAIILGVSEAIWHKVVAPLSKCEKNRVIIRNELGPGKGCGCRVLLETLKHTIQVKKNLCGQTREWIARTDGTYFQRNRIKPAAFVFPWINKKP
ncbi:BnaC08g42750D [Brassica napus]|uniref:BnaC08g42750D protein n=1 Tax=Brassica napus TaxID=3708 RepID=A0A078GBA5_BRANA|nr:BnaC08g42750D [Brassica napus]